MYHYALSLRRASFLMANSSWTKNHVDAILSHSDPLLNALHLLLPLWTSTTGPRSAEIVYPPCDTKGTEKFELSPRENVILSIAQFRYVVCLCQ